MLHFNQTADKGQLKCHDNRQSPTGMSWWWCNTRQKMYCQRLAKDVWG